MIIINLYNIRWRTKVNRKELAAATGISPATITKLTKGEHVDVKLSTLEKIAIGWGIPINTIGFAIKNRRKLIPTAKFYWDYKIDKYLEILAALESGGDKKKEILEKYMPLACYRSMIFAATRRVESFTSKEYNLAANQYPLDLDKTFNPKHIPKK